jgi:hypothetical protein
MIVPVPLSVAPDAPSHESRCALSSTYSSGSSVPGILPTTLNAGTSPRNSAWASMRSRGDWPRSAKRATSP